MKVHVLVSDPVNEEGLSSLRDNQSFEVNYKTGLKPDQLLKELNGTEALLVRSETKVTAEVIAQAKNLRFVGRAGTGVDNIDLNAASKAGIVVANVPGGNTISACEQALALMFAMARNTPAADASMKAGKWERPKFMGIELTGKTLGVLGLGRIGREVASRAQGLQMKVVAFDPMGDEAWCRRAGIALTSFEEVIAQSDFLTIHVPLIDQTKNLLRKETFAKCKKGIRIINCSRGGIVNEADLVEAVKAGQVKGAALDVFEKEPLPADSPLRQVPEIILTPHLGASTEEAQVKVAAELAVCMAEFFEKGFARVAVNLPSLDVAGQTHLYNYVPLADKLGAFLGQVTKGQVPQAITMKYSGDLGKLTPTLITATAVSGFLKFAQEKRVSPVNALALANELHVTVSEQSSPEAKDYASLLEMELKTDKGTFMVAGTVYGRGDLRLVRIDDLPVDTIPEGTLLAMKNTDKPGVVGHTGTVLSAAGINIAGMEVGRNRPGGTAVSLWRVDVPVPEDVLEKVKSHPAILSVKTVRL
jgi:D-3-phosphoglycerate dehydrogenase / 2-oxoglutarate reductase